MMLMNLKVYNEFKRKILLVISYGDGYVKININVTEDKTFAVHF